MARQENNSYDTKYIWPITGYIQRSGENEMNASVTRLSLKSMEWLCWWCNVIQYLEVENKNNSMKWNKCYTSALCSRNIANWNQIIETKRCKESHQKMTGHNVGYGDGWDEKRQKLEDFLLAQYSIDIWCFKLVPVISTELPNIALQEVFLKCKCKEKNHCFQTKLH